MQISLNENLEKEVGSEKSFSSEPVLTKAIVPTKYSVDENSGPTVSEPILTKPIVSTKSSVDGNSSPSVSKRQMLEEGKPLKAPTSEVDKLGEGHSDNEKIGLVIRKRRKKDNEVRTIF